MGSEVYQELKEYFLDDPDLFVNSGRGAQGIKYGKKMIVMFYKGDITVQLSPARVTELINSGEGLPHDPGTGTPMRNRVLPPVSLKNTWIALCEESRDYAKGK